MINIARIIDRCSSWNNNACLQTRKRSEPVVRPVLAMVVTVLDNARNDISLVNDVIWNFGDMIHMI